MEVLKGEKNCPFLSKVNNVVKEVKEDNVELDSSPKIKNDQGKVGFYEVVLYIIF